MLRDAAEAEDVVQEAFRRLVKIRLDNVDDVRAWLTVVVRRLCLNRLSSAHSRREFVAADDLPDGAAPGITALAEKYQPCRPLFYNV